MFYVMLEIVLRRSENGSTYKESNDKKQCEQDTQVERVIDGTNDWFDSKQEKT